MRIRIVRMRMGNGRVCMFVHVLPGHAFVVVVVMQVIVSVSVSVSVLNRLVDMLVAMALGDVQPHA